MEVSIIIACYNGAACSPRLVSCLNEFDEGRTEIIFVDDGSSDESYLAPRQRNAGLGGARNRAGVHGEFLQLFELLSWTLVRWTPKSAVPPNG